MKVCGKCSETKPVAEFAKRTRSPDGLQAFCRPCQAGAMRRSRYGLSPDDYAALVDSQGASCAICGARASRRGLFVDHEHSSGMVRGLLCNDCNTGLGMFRDSPMLLAVAIAYLDRADSARP